MRTLPSWIAADRQTAVRAATPHSIKRKPSAAIIGSLEADNQGKQEGRRSSARKADQFETLWSERQSW